MVSTRPFRRVKTGFASYVSSVLIASAAWAQSSPGPFDTTPFHFERNVGQSPAGAFIGFAPASQWMIDANGAWMILHREGRQQAIRMKLAGSGSGARCEAAGKLSSVSHYHASAGRGGSHANVEHWARVHCRNVYPGIDAIYYGKDGELEYDLTVAPGADPSLARIEYEGVDSIRHGQEGEVILATALGEVRQLEPTVYQRSEGSRVEVAAKYSISGNSLAFELGEFDRSLPLVIDPRVVYTYSLTDTNTFPRKVATDRSGNVIVTGALPSIPAPSLTPQTGQSDAIITKLDATGTLLWSVRIAGSLDDWAAGAGTDSNNNVIVMIATDSKDIPQVNPYSVVIGPGRKTVVAKLEPAGNLIRYLLYVGGSGNSDVPSDLAVDQYGSAVVVGETNSQDFPQVHPINFGFLNTKAPFITKVNRDGGSFDFSTIFGGYTSYHTSLRVTTDYFDGYYVSGTCDGLDFPILGPSSPPLLRPNPFLIKFHYNTKNFLSVVASRYIPDGGQDMAMDHSSNEPYLLGNNKLTKWSADFSTAVWQVSLTGVAMSVDDFGTILVTGTTVGNGPALVNPVQGCRPPAAPSDGDATVFKIDRGGNILISSCIGPSGADAGQSVANTGPDIIYVAGADASLPMAGFLAKIDATCATASLSTSIDLVPPAGAARTLQVTAPAGCAWQLHSNVSWLTFSPAGGTGSATVNYAVAPNPGTPRTGILATGGPFLTVNQEGIAALPVITLPVANEAVGSAAVTIRWTSASPAFLVRVTNLGTGQTAFSGTVVGADLLIATLPEGNFRARVQGCLVQANNAINSGACTAEATRDFSVLLQAPAGVPTIAFPANGAALGASTQTFQWTRVAGASRYELQLINAAAGGTAELQVSTLDPDTATTYSLRSSASYQLRVRACLSKCGAWSPATVFSVGLPPIPTTAPIITRAVVLGGNNLQVEWDAVNNADIYVMRVIQPTSGPGGGALTVASLRTSELTAGFPIPAGFARVIVTGCNGNGCGPYSDAKPVTAVGANPTTPVLSEPLGGSIVDGPVVVFSWSRVPGDDGVNTIYRLYVQDLTRQTTALDVYTNRNFYAAAFRAEGTRYDAVVIADPGTGQQSPSVAAGFNVRGQSAAAPTLTAPAHQGIVRRGNVSINWTPVEGATLYEYLVSGISRGVTGGLGVQVPMGPGTATAIVRACPAGATCAPDSDAGWGPWSSVAGTGVTTFNIGQ